MIRILPWAVEISKRGQWSMIKGQIHTYTTTMSLASISRLSLRTACKSAASCSISRADFASSSRTAEAAASTITKKEGELDAVHVCV